MGDCILIYNKDGGVDGVQTVTGNVSKLYPQLLERTKDVEKAVELTAFTRTDTFQEGVIFPILSKYKVAVKKQLEALQPKNSVLQIVHNGKEHAVDIKKLQYKLVEANGFTTLQAYAQAGDESVMLGKVRMKAYKDGLAIESTNLGTTQVYVDGTLESLQGKGIGTEMYKYAINHTLRQGKPFYSDANQTASATGVWEKLKTTKVVKKEGDRNKIEAFPSTHFDNNQEVLPEVLIKYIKAEQAKDKQLSFEQKQDIKNALLSSPFANSQEMNEALQKAFYNEKGEFQVEEKKLKGLYNSYEIASIITSKELQKEIKSTLEALKNSEEVFENNVDFLNEFLNKTTTLNSLGKMVNTNPLLTEQEVIQELGGVVDEQEFADKIENLELKLEIGDTSVVEEVKQEDTIFNTVETVTPEGSSNYANMTEDGEGNFVFFHSSEEERTSIDPKKYNSNKNGITSSGEATAIGMVGGVSMYYTNPSDTENGIGAVKHVIKVPKSEVYDFNSDQLNFIEIAKILFSSEYPGRAFDANTQLAYVTRVAKSYGYKMVVAEWSGKSRAQSVTELTPFDTQTSNGNVVTKPFKETYQGNKEKGFRSVIPVTKVALLSGIYSEMNKELNSKNIYGPLYHMHHANSNYTQEAITELVEKSTDISQELKDKYIQALQYQEEGRSSRVKRGVELQMESIVKNAQAEIARIRSLPVKDMDGGTFNIDGSKYEGGGLVVPVVSQNYAQSEITSEKLLEFVEKHKDKIPENSTVKVGIFKFEKEAMVSLDLNILVSQEHRDTAIAFGKAAGQFSLFDLDALKRGDYDNTDLLTGATGENPVNFSTEEFVEIASMLSEGKMPESVFNSEVQFSINEAIDPKDVIYHGMMVADPQALEEAFPAVHPNKFYHHSTVEFKPQDTSNIEVGKAQELKVTGRITTDKVDALLVENPKSSNKDAHITLSTAEGVKPFEVNKEIENNRERITTVPAGTTVQTTEGYFNGKEDITSKKQTGPFAEVIEKLKQTGLAKNIYSLTNQEIEVKLTELGVGTSVSKQLASGIKVTAAGFTYKGDVFLNTDTMTLDTPIHEMGHLYLNMLRAGGKDTYDVLVKGMNLAKSKEAEAYRNHVKKYQPKLKEGTPEFYEEVLAQAIGDAGAKFLEGAQKDTFLDWLEEMWDSFKDIMGMSDYMKDKNGKNKHFKNITFGQFTQAIARDLFDHQTIEGLMASLPYASDGVFLKVKDDPKFTDSRGIDLEAYGVDFIDATLPVRSLEDVVAEYKGKVFFTTSDCTGVGYDSEGFPIQGGPGYTAIKKNVEDKIGFAALGDSGSKAFETRVLNIFGPGVKVAVMVMAQTPSSTLGNVYGGRYLGRGLRALKETLTPAEFKETLASIDNIILTNKKIIDSINAFEKSTDGYPLRKPLLELLHNADNYTSEEFAQEFIKDTTFDIRRELMQIIFLKDSSIAMDVSTHKIKRSLAEAGFNAYNFLKEFGDKTFLTDSLIKEDKGGMVLAGFDFITAKNKKEVEARVAATEGRGIKHEQFNGKLASNGGAFVLDGAYDIENNFVSAAEVETQLNPEYTEEIDKEFKKYAKKHRPIVEAVEGISAAEKKRFDAYLKKEGLTNATEAKIKAAFKDYAKENKIVAKEYKYMPTKHRIDFKKAAGKANPNLLLVSVPSLQAAVARGVGFAVTEQGQRELTAKATPKFSIAEFKAKPKVADKSLFQKMQDFKRMPEMKIIGEGLQQVENNDIKVQLEQTFALAEDQSISSDIIYLNELSQDLYDENIQDVQELIQEIEKKAAKQGIDIVGLGEKISSKTRDDIYDLLESLNTLTTAPSQEAFEDFIVQHELIFGTEKTPSIKVQKVLPSNKNKSLISLDTKASEYELFDKLGLVKVSEGVYQRVQKEELSDLYNKLYEISQYNEGILPVEAFPFLNKGGVLNLKTLRNAENRDIIIEDIKEFIENKVTTLDLPNTATDNTVLQQLLINKYAFNHPIVTNSEVDVQQEFENFNNFDGSEAYLTTDFISDFYQEYLAEKIKDSKLFKDFYSNFTINEKGIVLMKDDAITVGVIKDYLKERKVKKAKDLANYSLLSNHLPNLKEATEQSSDYSREFFRNLYTNNPMSLEKLRQDYSVLGANTILIKNSTENFVRVKGGVFELIATKNNVGFYEKIGENKGEYKTFKSEEPVLSVDSSRYGAEGVSIEDFIKTEKYYTKKQEGEIDDEYLACL